MESKMNRKIFLQELKQSLAGQLSMEEIQDNMEYYETYILEQIQRGQKEEEVIEQLGDPRLIAKTIMEASAKKEGQYSDDTFTQEKRSKEKIKRKKGFHIEYTPEGGVDVRIGRFKLNSWYGGVLILSLLFILIGLLGSIFIAVIPIIIPIALGIMLIRMISRES